jgi:type IV pilus biogenesis protein PilP
MQNKFFSLLAVLGLLGAGAALAADTAASRTTPTTANAAKTPATPVAASGAATSAAASAAALAPVTPRPDSPVLKASDALTRIEAETLVLKARDRQLAVQMAILAKQNEIASREGESERRVRASVSGNPVVQSVEGIGANKFATLELENGNLIDVRAGDRLANGMKVISVEQNAVMVETSGKRRVRLTSAANTPPPFNPSYPGSGVSLPMVFPGASGIPQ